MAISRLWSWMNFFLGFLFPSHLFFAYPNGGDDDVYCLVTIYEAFILCPSHSDELTCAIHLLALDFYSHASHCSVNYGPHLLDKLMVRQYDFIGTTWMSKADPPAVLCWTLKLKPLFLDSLCCTWFPWGSPPLFLWILLTVWNSFTFISVYHVY